MAGEGTEERIGIAWERIARWACDRFPELAESLCAGATEASIAGLEAELGRGLPRDLRASLALYDGQRRLPSHRGPAGLMWMNDAYFLLSVARIEDETRAYRAIAAHDPVPVWSADRIAVAASGTGDVISVDARGRLLAVMHDEEVPNATVEPDTFGGWLEALADDLARGRWKVSDWRSLEPNVPVREAFDAACTIAARSRTAEEVWSELARNYDQRVWIMRRLVRAEIFASSLA